MWRVPGGETGRVSWGGGVPGGETARVSWGGGVPGGETGRVSWCGGVLGGEKRDWLWEKGIGCGNEGLVGHYFLSYVLSRYHMFVCSLRIAKTV